MPRTKAPAALGGIPTLHQELLAYAMHAPADEVRLLLAYVTTIVEARAAQTSQDARLAARRKELAGEAAPMPAHIQPVTPPPAPALPAPGRRRTPRRRRTTRPEDAGVPVETPSADVPLTDAYGDDAADVIEG